MIGERLAELRKDRGLTQKKLAALLSLSNTTISGYETGKGTPSDETKVKIAKHFNISLDYLLGATDQEVALNRENVIVFPEGFTNVTQEKIIDYVKMAVHFHTNEGDVGGKQQSSQKGKSKRK